MSPTSFSLIHESSKHDTYAQIQSRRNCAPACCTIVRSLRRGHQNKTVVEYMLRDTKKQIAVAEYRLLPPRLKAQLPNASTLRQVVAQVEMPDEK